MHKDPEDNDTHTLIWHLSYSPNRTAKTPKGFKPFCWGCWHEAQADKGSMKQSFPLSHTHTHTLFDDPTGSEHDPTS